MESDNQLNMGPYKMIIETLGNPNGLLDMICFIESLNTKVQEILDFTISRTSGIKEIEDMEVTNANEIIENCKKEIPLLQETLDKAIEYRKEYEKKYCKVNGDNDGDMLFDMICMMFDTSIASADAAIFGSEDLIKCLESNMENMKLTHTYSSAE